MLSGHHLALIHLDVYFVIRFALSLLCNVEGLILLENLTDAFLQLAIGDKMWPLRSLLLATSWSKLRFAIIGLYVLNFLLTVLLLTNNAALYSAMAMLHRGKIRKVSSKSSLSNDAVCCCLELLFAKVTL